MRMPVLVPALSLLLTSAAPADSPHRQLDYCGAILERGIFNVATSSRSVYHVRRVRDHLSTLRQDKSTWQAFLQDIGAGQHEQTELEAVTNVHEEYEMLRYWHSEHIRTASDAIVTAWQQCMADRQKAVGAITLTFKDRGEGAINAYDVTFTYLHETKEAKANPLKISSVTFRHSINCDNPALAALEGKTLNQNTEIIATCDVEDTQHGDPGIRIQTEGRGSYQIRLPGRMTVVEEQTCEHTERCDARDEWLTECIVEKVSPGTYYRTWVGVAGNLDGWATGLDHKPITPSQGGDHIGVTFGSVDSTCQGIGGVGWRMSGMNSCNGTTNAADVPCARVRYYPGGGAGVRFVAPIDS